MSDERDGKILVGLARFQVAMNQAIDSLRFDIEHARAERLQESLTEDWLAAGYKDEPKPVGNPENVPEGSFELGAFTETFIPTGDRMTNVYPFYWPFLVIPYVGMLEAKNRTIWADYPEEQLERE